MCPLLLLLICLVGRVQVFVNAGLLVFIRLLLHVLMMVPCSLVSLGVGRGPGPWVPPLFLPVGLPSPRCLVSLAFGLRCLLLGGQAFSVLLHGLASLWPC